MSCYQEDARKLREAGYRLTPQRLMVLEALYHHEGHATAEEVWDRVRAQHPYVDLSTVYRTLQFLTRHGLVGELRVPGEPARYEAVHHHSHGHAICRYCGTEMEFPMEWLQPLVAQLDATYGFQADVEHLGVTGVCARCLAARENPSVVK
ncbi:MAG: Fur family transcriptional regulator [Anaerolineae bacterium]